MTPHYEERAPEPALAAHVHCTWRFEGMEEGIEQAVPPDGRCELIAHCGRPYEERGSDGAWHEQPALLFAGQLVLRSCCARAARSRCSACASRPPARGPSSGRR